MREGILLKSAALLGADIHMFHKPDNKWKNYYYEDKDNNVLFLLPSNLRYGPIVLDLDIAESATFVTGDGRIHRLRDYSWSVSSGKRRTSYPKVSVPDRTVECGKKTVLLNSVIVGQVAGNADEKYSVGHINGDTYDVRVCNLVWGDTKGNNDRKYSKEIPIPDYPCEPWWKD